jgi:two-component system, NarL family, response regulator LiaR
VATIRVFIADDHTLLRDGTRQILEVEPDLEVVGEAGDGERAAALIGELEPDVAICDLRMPGLNGIAVMERVRAAGGETRFLLLSAYDDVEYVLEALQAGASGYLLKTAPGQRLVEAVRAVAAGDHVLEPSLSSALAARISPRARANPELTRREREMLRLLAQGLRNKEIARELGISTRTVEGHLNNLYLKIGVGSRTEALLYAAEHHLDGRDR